MNTEMLPSLTALGVPPRLAAVYLFVVERGEVVARDVAEMFSYTRSTAHDVLSTLVRYGFARSMTRGKERIFFMESPQVMYEAFLSERRKAEMRADMFERIVPVLRALHTTDSSSVGVRYFSGVQGLRRIQKELLELPGDILQLVDAEAFWRMDVVSEQMFADHVSDQSKRTRSIVLSDRCIELVSMLGTEVRVVSRDLLAAPGQMMVCSDRVVFLSAHEDMVIVEIRSRAIAEVCRATFELAWKAAEEWGVSVPQKER